MPSNKTKIRKIKSTNVSVKQLQLCIYRQTVTINSVQQPNSNNLNNQLDVLQAFYSFVLLYKLCISYSVHQIERDNYCFLYNLIKIYNLPNNSEKL